ncbi:MAG: GyrI-like domain-containing protein [Syntrophomonas sp.]
MIAFWRKLPWARIVGRELILKIVPPAWYAVFTPERPLNPIEYGQLVLYVYGEWLPMKGLQTDGDYSMDVTYSGWYFSGYYMENSRLEVYIPVK